MLKEKNLLSGTVRFIFQPAEESSNGACNVIEAGHLRGVQAIFGMHNKPDLPVGTIGIKDGPLIPELIDLKLKFTELVHMQLYQMLGVTLLSHLLKL